MPLIDLLAILPFFAPFGGADLRSLRAIRLLRVVRIAKLGRYYSSLDLIKQVFRLKKEELVLTSILMCLLLIVSSSVLYCCENEAQPETFSSIPATMWWAVATLTTVGYGDMYPVTFDGTLVCEHYRHLGNWHVCSPNGHPWRRVRRGRSEGEASSRSGDVPPLREGPCVKGALMMPGLVR